MQVIIVEAIRSLLKSRNQASYRLLDGCHGARVDKQEEKISLPVSFLIRCYTYGGLCLLGFFLNQSITEIFKYAVGAYALTVAIYIQ